jgi:hypothetical protein
VFETPDLKHLKHLSSLPFFQNNIFLSNYVFPKKYVVSGFISFPKFGGQFSKISFNNETGENVEDEIVENFKMLRIQCGQYLFIPKPKKPN